MDTLYLCKTKILQLLTEGLNICKKTVFTYFTNADGQGTWTQKTDFGGATRYWASGFSVGGYGYLGTGYNGSALNDVWKYDTAANAWTQVASYPGGGALYVTGFSIGNKGYFGCGWNFSGYKNDFWEYDPAGNSWTQKNYFPGVARWGASGFGIGTKGYIGVGDASGNGTGDQVDFYEWDQNTNTWSQKANFIGAAVYGGVGFSIGTKGYIGTGYSNSTGSHSEFYEYDQSTNTWTQKANFGGAPRYQDIGFSIGTKGYIGSGSGGSDFWAWDQNTNTWTQQTNYPGSAGEVCVGFSIGTKGFVGTGQPTTKQFWEFDGPCTPPVPVITPSGATTFCQGGSVTLDAGTWTAYSWSNSATTESINVTTSGTYTVTVTNSTGCTGTASQIVTVNPNPIPTITQNGFVLDAGVYSSYLWNDGATTETINISMNGTYSVTVTNGSGCTGTASLVVSNMPCAATAYITNSSAHSVSVINVTNNTVESTIQVGTYPQGVSISSDGTKVYVANGLDNTVSVINTSTNTVSATITVGTEPVGLSVSSDGTKVYTANYAANNVSVINTTTNTVSATITVGTNPYGIIVTPDGSKVYVVNDASNTVSVINTATNTVSATITGFNEPYGIAVSPDGSKVYVVNEIPNTVSVINTATNSISATINVGTGPYAVAVSPDGSKAYVTNEFGNSVSVINTATNTVSATVTVGSHPYGISVNPDGTKVYVSNNSDNTVSVINTSNNSVTGTIAVGFSPVALGNFIGCTPCSIFTPVINQYGSILDAGVYSSYIWNTGATTSTIPVTTNGTYSVTVTNGSGCTGTASITGVVDNCLGTAYITNQGSNNVSVINIATHTVTATVPVGNFPKGVCVKTDGTRAYIANANDGTVSVINTSTNTVIATIPVGSYPEGMAVSQDGTTLYVANFDSNTLSVINTATNTVTATITVSATPLGVSVSPDGTRVYVADLNANTVNVINTSTNTVSATIAVGSGPLALGVSPDGSKVYVTNSNDNTVSVINTQNNTVVATIPVGSGPGGIAFSPDGSKAYITNGGGTESIINTSTNTVINTVSIGNGPGGTAISPDGSKLYLVVYNNNKVRVLNTATNTITDSISVGTNPIGFGNFIACTTPCSPFTPVITPNGDTTFCQGGSVTLDAGSYYSYSWSTGATTESITVSTSGTYSVTVINSSGCSGNASKVVTVGTDITTGLIAQYDFTGNANDVSGNGYNGTVNGATLTADRFGNANSAYSFNGTGQNITVPNFNINTQALTVSFWVNPTSLASAQRLISHDWNNTGAFTCTLDKQSGPPPIDNPMTVIRDASNAQIHDWSSYTVTTGTWYNYVFIYDGANINVYINNVLVASTPSATIKNVSAMLYLGGDGLGANGVLDDIRIYNRVLTSCDLDSLYNMPNPCSLLTPVITANGPATFCQGGSVTLDAGSWTSYLWSNNATTETINTTTSGTYTVTVTNGSGCTGTASQIVTVVVPDITSGLIAEYDFTGNANDVTGNGNNGTVNGATLTTDRFGNPNNAYNFDGNSKIQLIMPSQYAPSASNYYSFSLWFNKSSDAVSKMILQYMAGTNNNVSNYDILSCHSSCNAGTMAVQNYPFYNPSACSPDIVSIGVWTHICVIFDQVGQSFQVYKNGVYWFSGPIGNLPPYSGYLTIGNNSGGTFGFFGKIDDIRIYNRALTSCDVDSLYNMPNPCSLLSPVINANGPTTFCQGGSVTLDAGSWTSYLWSNNATTETINATSSGTFTVTVTNSSGCTGTASQVVTVVVPDITSGLVARYDFMGNANDLSGLNNNGTVIGASLTTDRFGNPNSAYSFNGSTDYINVGDPINNSLDFLGGPYSISVWVKTSQSSYAPVVTKQDPNIPNQSGDYNLDIIQYARTAMGFGGGNGEARSSINTVNDNIWHHIVSVYTQNTLDLYVDGILSDGFSIGIGTAPNTLANSPQPLLIGKGWQGNLFNGTIDDVKIYSRALTSCDIDSLYNMPNPCSLLTPVITANGPTTFCQGGSVTLDAGSWTSYLWSNNATTETISATTSGTYTVTVTNSSGCTGTASIVVTVNPNPTPTITQNGHFLDAGLYSSYIWSTGATTETIYINNSGIYSVTVTNGNGCTGTASITATIISCTATAYITNNVDNTVSVIDVATNTVTATIPVGVNPYGVSVSTDGSKVYVANYNNSNTGSVSVINTANNSVSNIITVGAGPQGICVTPDGSQVYVANENSNTVSVINTGTNTVSAVITVGSNPWGVATSPDGSKVYITNYTPGTVSVINTANNTVSATITVGSNPLGIAVSPDGSKIYVSKGDWTVSVINTTTNTVSAIISVGVNPHGVSVSPDGTKVFVANYGANSVSVINAVTNTVSATITVGTGPYGLSVSPDGTELYAANYGGGNGNISVINTSTNTVSATIAVGHGPLSFGNFIGCIPQCNSLSPVITPNSDTTFCQGGSVTLDAGSWTSYSWSNNATTQTINASTSGTYTVTVTNSSGCTGTASIVVTVNTPAIITICTGNVTQGNDLNQCGAIVTYSAPTVSGNPVPTITYSQNSGTSFAVGTTTVLVTATNTCGTSTCSFTVTVNDVQPPTINCPSDVTINNTPGLCTGTTSLATPAFSDNCSDTGAVTLTNTVTFEAWVYPNGEQVSAAGIIFNRHGGNANGINFGYVDQSKIGYHWNNDPNTFNWTGGPTYTPNVWNHVALVIEPTKATVYLNGVPFVNNYANPLISLDSATLLGKDPVNTIRHFNGTMDEVRIWNYALSQAEIIATMNTALTGNEPGLINYYNFDEGIANGNNTGLTTLNAIRGNNGTLNNFALSGSTSNWTTGEINNGLNFDGNDDYVDIGTLNFNTHVLTLTNNSPSTYPVGNTTVTWTATDAGGNTATCNQTVTVVDNEVPLITCPSNITQSNCSDVVTFTVNATDNCSATVVSSPASGSIFSVGTTTVTNTATDASGNTSTCSFIVTVLSATPVITPSGATTFCQGGSVTLDAGSWASYLWSNSATTESISVSTSGTYTVTVTNGSGCTGTTSIVVTVNPSPTATITPNGPTTFCQGGSVILTASANSSYLWSTGATTQSITVSTSGSYTVTVTNGNGCTAVSSATTVTVNPSPTATITPNGPTTFCQGGSVILTASANSSYLWSTGATTQSITVSTSGSYTVTVTNGNGCTAISSATTVTVNPSPTATITPNGPTTFCQGGSVILTASSNSSYLWSTGATTQSITVSTSGSYTVTVTNGNGCTAISSATTVTVNPSPTATITPNGPTTFCQGGSVILTANSNSSYLWSTGATTQSITVSTSGSYTVTVTNGNGCTAISSATTVTVNPSPTATITPNGPTTFCQGGSVILTASANSSYLWSTGATTQSITVSTSGSYTLTVTNGNGCTAISSATTVTVNPSPTATITPNGPTAFCQGGSVILTASANNSYLWSTGATTQSITVSTSGSYTVTVTNGNGCTAISSATTVTVNSSPTATITPNGPTIFCQGDSVILTASSNSSYLWSTGATIQSITVSTSGSYTITVTNGNGCSAISSATTVTVNPSPTATITPSGPTTFCQGGSVILTASANSSYLWSTGASIQSITVSTTGSYTVTVTNGNGCTAISFTTTVTVNPSPTATITPNGPTTFCQGGSVILTASANSSYLWSTGATTQSITVSTSGSYSVTVTNGNGCTAVSSATTVTVNPSPTATITPNGPTTFCQGDSVTLTTNLNSSYLWSTGATTQSITVSTSGGYTVTVTNGNGCTAMSSSTTVMVIPKPTAVITPNGPTTFCQGDSVILTVNSNSFYLWSTGATTQSITVLSSGTFTVTVTNGIGCTDVSLQTFVTVNPAPTASITPSGPTTFCQGGSVTLTANVNNSYLWSNSQTTQSITVTTGSTYTVTVTNSSGCTASASTTVTVTPGINPLISFDGALYFCQGDSVILIAGNYSSYSWNTGATTDSISVNTSGTYTVSVTNNSGCTGSASRTVTVYPLPIVSFTGLPDSVCSYSGNYTLTGTPPGGGYFGAGINGNIFNPANAPFGNNVITYYYTNAEGCYASTTHTVFVGLCTGIPIIANDANGFNVYPNPADDHIIVAFSSKDGSDYSVKLVDMLGRTIKEDLGKAVYGDNSIAIDLMGVAKGMYMIILQKGDNISKTKLIVE